MKREHELRRRLRSLTVLSEAVTAMKTMSAVHFRRSRDELGPARAYRGIVDEIVSAADLRLLKSASASSRFLVISSDVGLCDGYNSRVAQAASESARHLGVRSFYAVGRRAVASLQREGLSLVRKYPAPSSVDGLTRVVVDLAQEVVEDYVRQDFGVLYAVSARFQGVGSFQVAATQVLPASPGPPHIALQPSPYVGSRRLAMVALREYLYITFYELLLDSLAAEYGARLVATESAAEWLDDRIAKTSRRLTAVRRETGTQDVIEIASGARRRRRDLSAGASPAPATGSAKILPRQ